jgi:hypothetical protein
MHPQIKRAIATLQVLRTPGWVAIDLSAEEQRNVVNQFAYIYQEVRALKSGTKAIT